MALPEFVTPVLAVVGTPALAYAIARSFPHAARAVVVLVAGIVAILTRDENRGKRCLEVLRILRGRDSPEQPPDGYGVPMGELRGSSPARRPPRSRVRSRRARDLCAPPRPAGLVPGQGRRALADLTWSFAVANFAQPVVQIAPTAPIALVVTGGQQLEMTTSGSAGAVTSVGGRTGAIPAVTPLVVPLVFGASIAVDASTGNAFNLTLTSSAGVLQNPTNPTDGQVIRFRVTQGGAGGFTLAYASAYDFGSAGAPVLSTAAGKVDIVVFEYVASISKWCYLGSALGF